MGIGSVVNTFEPRVDRRGLSQAASFPDQPASSIRWSSQPLGTYDGGGWRGGPGAGMLGAGLLAAHELERSGDTARWLISQE